MTGISWFGVGVRVNVGLGVSVREGAGVAEDGDVAESENVGDGTDNTAGVAGTQAASRTSRTIPKQVFAPVDMLKLSHNLFPGCRRRLSQFD